jgi:hypothetical protein
MGGSSIVQRFEETCLRIFDSIRIDAEDLGLVRIAIYLTACVPFSIVQGNMSTIASDELPLPTIPFSSDDIRSRHSYSCERVSRFSVYQGYSPRISELGVTGSCEDWKRKFRDGSNFSETSKVSRKKRLEACLSKLFSFAIKTRQATLRKSGQTNLKSHSNLCSEAS